MAKRRSRKQNKQGSVGGDLLVKAFGTLFVLLVMIGSFLLFAAWLYFEHKKKLLSEPKSLHDFDHDSNELKEIERKEDKLSSIYQRLEQIEIEGRSLSTRQDGKYNERSKKGKQFNLEIERLSPEAETLEQVLADLEALPEKRLNNWAFYASMNVASRIAIMVYICSFWLFLWLEPVWVMQLSSALQKITLLDFYASFPIAYGASVGSLFLSLAALFGSFMYYREKNKDALRNSTERHNESSLDLDLSALVASAHIAERLSELSHAELKLIADKLNITADRRSKKSILDAIKETDTNFLVAVLSKN